MTNLECWYRRNFCETINYGFYGSPRLRRGEVHWISDNGRITYIYVGKGKLWVKTIK